MQFRGFYNSNGPSFRLPFINDNINAQVLVRITREISFLAFEYILPVVCMANMQGMRYFFRHTETKTAVRTMFKIFPIYYENTSSELTPRQSRRSSSISYKWQIPNRIVAKQFVFFKLAVF